MFKFFFRKSCTSKWSNVNVGEPNCLLTSKSYIRALTVDCVYLLTMSMIDDVAMKNVYDYSIMRFINKFNQNNRIVEFRFQITEPIILKIA